MRWAIDPRSLRDCHLFCPFFCPNSCTTFPAGVVAAQPLAALPPYGCGVPLAGAISQNNIASCMFSGEYEIFLIREALNKSARAVSEGFCSKLRFENRRNTLCISRFSNRKVGTKDPLSAAADLFRASLDCHVAALLAMTRRGLFRHAERNISIINYRDYGEKVNQAAPYAKRYIFP